MKNPGRKWLLQDAVCGMLGGAVATYAMDKITGLMYACESDEVKKKEAALMQEPAYNLLARKLAGRAGIPLTDPAAAKAGSVFHWSYGVAWGGIYGMLRNQAPLFSKAAGLPFGVSVFVLGDEALNTVLEISPPPQKFPLAVHVRGLVGHVVYAATVDGVCRMLGSIFPESI